MCDQMEQILMRRIVPAAPKTDTSRHQVARYGTVCSVIRAADAAPPVAFAYQRLCRPQTIQTQFLPGRQCASPYVGFYYIRSGVTTQQNVRIIVSSRSWKKEFAQPFFTKTPLRGYI